MDVQCLLQKYKQPYLVNRILSMNKDNITKCSYINKFVGKVDNKILEGLFKVMFRGNLQFLEYIKNSKNKEEDNELLLKIKEYYNWSKRDLKEQKEFLLSLTNREKGKYEMFFGM